MNEARTPFRSPLYWRLLSSFCLANLLALALGGVLGQRFVQYTATQALDWSALARSADAAYRDGGIQGFDRWSRLQREAGVNATLYVDGQPLRMPRLPASLRQQLPMWIAAGHDILLQPWPGYYLAIQQLDDTDGHHLQMVASSNSRARMPPHTRQTIYLLFQLSSSLLLIGAAGWWVARSVSRPVDALRGATRQMAQGAFSTRLGSRWSTSRDELGQLARDFNAMAERIESLVTRDRIVLQDLSHEIRSPLARLQLLLELARRSDNQTSVRNHFDQAEREVQRLDRLTGDMLALSRLEAQLPGMRCDQLALDRIIRERVQAARLEAVSRGVELRLSGIPLLRVAGNASLLELAMDNLLSNAIKFSPAGSVVEIGANADQGWAHLQLRDHGPGVPGDELDRLFQPFFRGINGRQASGHGLGLTIAQRICKVHKGVITAVNAEGGGLAIELRLPMASHFEQEPQGE